MTERPADRVLTGGEQTSIAPWQIAAIWTIPAVLSTVETVTFARLGAHPIAVWRAFVSEAPQWYGWAILTPAIITLGKRFSLHRPVRPASVLVHVAASLGGGLLLAIGDALVNAWVRPSSGGLLANARNWFLGGLPATTLAYFAILGASYAWRSAIQLRARDREAAALETQLREAQLATLRMQLQPHFLFNTLNAIMALVRDVETERAIQALSLLSDVLYTTIRASDEQATTLAKELAFVGRYLEIERVRFGDRLNVAVDVVPGVANALVPTFLLQPFVENALRHGLAPRRTGGNVHLSASSEDGQLVICVTDNGIGLPPDWEERMSHGVGVANARARLARMYGDAGSVTISPLDPSSGTKVSVRLPLRFV